MLSVTTNGNCLHILGLVFGLIILCGIFIPLTIVQFDGSEFNFPQWFLILQTVLNIMISLYILINSFYTCVKTNKQKAHKNERTIFSKLKSALLYFFGVCVILHNIFYLFLQNENDVSLVMNSSTLLYILCLFFHFYSFSEGRGIYTGTNLILCMLISFANISNFFIPLLDYTYFFKCITDNNSTTHGTQNISRITLESLQVADSILLPCVIGFYLLFFDFEFSDFNQHHKNQSSNKKKTLKDYPKYDLLKKICQHFFSMVSFALFCFVVTEHTLDAHQEVDFNTFIALQLFVKIVLLVLIGIVFFYFIRGRTKYTCSYEYFDIWFILILVTFVGTVLYHVSIVITAIDKESLNDDVSLINNVVSILVAIIQTLVLSRTYIQNGNEGYHFLSENTIREEIIYSLFSVLSIINIGLWISDSISIAWVNGMLICKNLPAKFLGFLNIFLYFSPSFHFVSAFELLRLSWERSFLKN